VTEESERGESKTERATLACIAFANTMCNYHADDTADVLNSYTDLVRWAQEAEILSAEEARRLLERASHRPGEAKSVLKDAKQLRRTIYNIFSDIAHMRAPSDEDVAELNSRLTKVQSHMQISQRGGDFFWDWEDKSNDLNGVLWSMVRCAANLLCSGELGRVSGCNSETCTWLFLDRSKNVSRKWCDMGTCGNRAKSRRHYARTHGQAKADA